MAALASAGCKDKGGDSASADLDARCATMAKACGDKDKHVTKITEECKAVAKKHSDKGCGAKALALYACFEKTTCGGADKVWALDDLRVLSERHADCVIERDALKGCTAKPADKPADKPSEKK